MIDIIKELGRPLTFKPVFDSLRQKAALDRHRLLSHPVNHDLTLEWVLRNEVQVVKTLTKQIRKHKYRPQTAQQHQILLDKPRQLFSLAWPDRIVEMAIAKIINQAISPSYTESLYSYRKGYGNLAAIKSLTGFIVQQHKLDNDIYLAKRDIENFGQSIDTNLLLQKLTSTLGKQSDYLWILLRGFLQPTFTNPLINEKKQLLSGLPDGYALTPVCENFFLNDIDSQLDPGDSSDPAKATNGERQIEGRQDFYIRYGDDILLASTKRDTLLGNLSILEQGLTRLGLHYKSSKSTNLIFSNTDGQDHRGDDIFKLSKHVDYLGHSVSNNGEIFISQNKLEKLKSKYAVK